MTRAEPKIVHCRDGFGSVTIYPDTGPSLTPICTCDGTEESIAATVQTVLASLAASLPSNAEVAARSAELRDYYATPAALVDPAVAQHDR
jgi:hypothetical protein